MGSQSTLLELGDRYWALGLPAAAQDRAAARAGQDRRRRARAAADRRRARPGRHPAARASTPPRRSSARRGRRRGSCSAGPSSRRASSPRRGCRCSRRSTRRKLTPWDRARAHLELARAADAQGDAPGRRGAGRRGVRGHAARRVAAAARPERSSRRSRPRSSRTAARADAQAIVDGARDQSGATICAAALLAARQAAGDTTVTDGAIDHELAGLRRRARRSGCAGWSAGRASPPAPIAPRCSPSWRA